MSKRAEAILALTPADAQAALDRALNEARLEEAQEARKEFDEHFYSGSNDPEGLRECLDIRIAKLEVRLKP